MKTRAARAASGERGGFILIAVVVVIMLASMVVVTLLFRLRAEETAAAAGTGSEQAWAAAMSGIGEAIKVVMKTPPGSLEWQDNPAAFRERLVIDDGADRWFFSIYTQAEAEREDVRFGLTDEASKLNLNHATEAMFEKLPKMTPYLVQGLLDFLDSDNTPRPEGAEQEYYDALPRPYAAANGPLTTLEQLLLVRGFTAAVVYGEDANLNFHLDPNEDDGEAQFPPDNKDGKLDLGLRALLTVSSYDLDLDNAGLERIQVNRAEASLDGKSGSRSEDFPPALLTYVEALRRNKVELSQPADLLEAKAKLKDEAGQEVELESGVGKTELPIVLDRLTTRSERRMPGLINVNTASAAVLQTLPGVDEALADSIVAARKNLRVEQRLTAAWLYQEGLLDSGQFKKLMPYLTTRSYQFHVQVVGYGIPSGRYRVLEAIIDAAEPSPRIAYLRDITRLGLPFRVEPQGDGEELSPATDKASSVSTWSRGRFTANFLKFAGPKSSRLAPAVHKVSTVFFNHG